MARQRFLAFLLLVAFCADPILVLAQKTEFPEVPPAETGDGAVSAEPLPAEELVIEEETPYDPSMPGEILATSTEAIEEPAEEALIEEVIEPVLEIPELVPGTYVPDEVVVQYENEESPVTVDTEGESVEEVIAALSADPDIEFIEPNFVRSLDLLSSTTDTYAEDLWNLEKISADLAWASSTGTDIIVAVIDTGVDYTHPDLAANMWDGSSCTGFDKNGSPLSGGCVHGFDFADNDTDPMPISASSTYYHGTHVAGTIAAAYDNQTGIIGVAPNVKIMALRFGLNTSDEAKAIDFAIANGAKIINASFSGSAPSTIERDAIERFEAAGGLFIAAAGNGGDDEIGDNLDPLLVSWDGNEDARPAYPASYDLASVISVAATDQADLLADFSNFGAGAIDLGAPGVDVISTMPGTGYNDLSGTSMATPHVVGAVALVNAFRPQLSASEVKSIILDSGDVVSDLTGKTVSGKRLNAFAALAAAEAATVVVTPPPSSGGGGGGGGGGGSSKKKKDTKKKETKKKDEETPQPRLPQVQGTTTRAPLFFGSLYEGSSGTEASELQKALAKLGFYTGPVTGYVGPLTIDALKRYQASRGLAATGINDEATRAKLNDEYEQNDAERMSYLLSLLSELQALLARLRAV